MIKVAGWNQRHVDGVAAEVPEVTRKKRESSVSVAVLGEPICTTGIAWRAVVLRQRDFARDAHRVNQLPVSGGLVALAAGADDPVIFFRKLNDIALVGLAELAVRERAKATDRVGRVAQIVVDDIGVERALAHCCSVYRCQDSDCGLNGILRARVVNAEFEMADPLLSSWPLQGTDRRVVGATADAVELGQGVYRITFLDSSGRKLFVQLPMNALRSLVDSGAQLLRERR